MTKVALVANEDVVRVTPQSENAVPATFRTWTEAVAYCEEKRYTIHNESEANEFCLKELEALEVKDDEEQGGEGSDA